MQYFFYRTQTILQKQRPISSKAFLILAESQINPGFENQIGESSSEGNARKIVQALNSKERLEIRVSKLEILIRDGISGLGNSEDLEKSVNAWIKSALDLLDEES